MLRGHTNPLPPKPPPRNFETTRIDPALRRGMPSASANPSRIMWTPPWAASCTVRPPSSSQLAIVTGGSIGLWWWTGVR